MALPLGHELKTIGLSPENMQLIELQRFSIEQIARIYSLPPVFLQDLTHGTFSNTEQQDLHFVKHCVKRWVEQFEQESNDYDDGFYFDEHDIENDLDREPAFYVGQADKVEQKLRVQKRYDQERHLEELCAGFSAKVEAGEHCENY